MVKSRLTPSLKQRGTKMHKADKSISDSPAQELALRFRNADDRSVEFKLIGAAPLSAVFKPYKRKGVTVNALRFSTVGENVRGSDASVASVRALSLNVWFAGNGEGSHTPFCV